MLAAKATWDETVVQHSQITDTSPTCIQCGGDFDEKCGLIVWVQQYEDKSAGNICGAQQPLQCQIKATCVEQMAWTAAAAAWCAHPIPETPEVSPVLR